jgi:hypothetical protein
MLALFRLAKRVFCRSPCGGSEEESMKPILDRTSIRARLAAFLLIAGLAAGPLSTHVYWMLGGTWGLHRTVVGDRVVEEGATSTGTRIVAAVVVVLLVAADLVVLARGRAVAAGIGALPDDSVFCLGAGGGVPARDAGGLHLE